MIRINLAPPVATSSRVVIPKGRRGSALGVLLLLGTACGLGIWWWMLSRQAVGVDARVARTERELLRLNETATLVNRAVAQKAELASRLSLIERLRAAQRGPVAIVTTIGRSLPDGLWLLELTQRGGTLQIDGRATSLTSVTDFAERLQSSGTFDRPVDILTTSMETVGDVPVVRFALKAQTLGAEPAEPAAVAARKGD
jgi:type IV pilus assembly protein PilN